MSTLLRTSNPAVMAEIDPGRDHRIPYQGQIVIFHARQGEGRGGKLTAPAIVTAVEDEDHVEIMIIYAADDFHTRWNIPRRTEQNPFNAWSFNDHDEVHYRPGAPKPEAPKPDGHLDWSDVESMHHEIGTLRNRLAALEAGQRPEPR